MAPVPNAFDAASAPAPPGDPADPRAVWQAQALKWELDTLGAEPEAAYAGPRLTFPLTPAQVELLGVPPWGRRGCRTGRTSVVAVRAGDHVTPPPPPLT